MLAYVGLVFSAICAGLALPYSLNFFTVFSVSCGFAVFWWALIACTKNQKKRFWISFWWFFVVQAMQLSWLTSDIYMGPMIWVFYVAVCMFFGLQFSFLSFLLKNVELVTVYKIIQIPKFSLSTCFNLASLWTLLEFSREFLFTTCSWNPLGLLLSLDRSCAFASVFGVLGLSFWVVFVNAFFLYAIGSLKKTVVWFFLVGIPFLYSFLLQQFLIPQLPTSVLSVSCVQTALLPEEKDFSFSRGNSFIHPLNQWERIFDELEKTIPGQLIVLPETAVSFGAYRPIYDLTALQRVWQVYFGFSYEKDFPELEAPLAAFVEKAGKKTVLVTNAFICQALANHFNGQVIAGFDVQDGGKQFNSALYFQGGKKVIERVDKKILVPITETVDLFALGSFLRPIAKSFGLTHFLDKGEQAKVLGLEKRFGVCICVEEIYGDIPAKLKEMGSDVLVSLSNDVWFPNSKLPYHHFLHGKIRAAENGIGLVRSCNTGVSCFINCLGQCVESIAVSENKISTLQGDFLISQYRTVYSTFGEIPLIYCCLFVFLRILILRNNERFLGNVFVFLRK